MTTRISIRRSLLSTTGVIVSDGAGPRRRRAVGEPAAVASPRGPVGLTTREAEELTPIDQGPSNREIARRARLPSDGAGPDRRSSIEWCRLGDGPCHAGGTM